MGSAEGRGRKRPFASHLPSFDEDCTDDAAASAIEDARSPATQRRRSSRGTSPFSLDAFNQFLDESETLCICSKCIYEFNEGRLDGCR